MTSPGDHPRASWASLPPGTVLDAVVEMLSPRTLSRADLAAAVAACERQVSHLNALQCRMIAELWRRDVEGRRSEPGHSEGNPRAATRVVASVLTLETALAAKRVQLAVDLVADFAATLDALDAGRITVDKATVITERIRHLKPGARAVVEAAALEQAPRLTRRQLHYWLDDAAGPGHRGHGRANGTQ